MINLRLDLIPDHDSLDLKSTAFLKDIKIRQFSSSINTSQDVYRTSSSILAWWKALFFRAVRIGDTGGSAAYIAFTQALLDMQFDHVSHHHDIVDHHVRMIPATSRSMNFNTRATEISGRIRTCWKTFRPLRFDLINRISFRIIFSEVRLSRNYMENVLHTHNLWLIEASSHRCKFCRYIC